MLIFLKTVHHQPFFHNQISHLLLNTKFSSLLLLLLLSCFSCVRLCNPIDGSPPGSSVPGILQARTLEWVAISFSKACMHAKLLQSCLTVQPHRWQPTRFLCPQDSLGKNTAVGCHFLLSFKFLATVTTYRDLGAQENKICHCFHFSPFYLP